MTDAIPDEVIDAIWREPCGLHNHPDPKPCRACCYVCNAPCDCECGGCGTPPER